MIEELARNPEKYRAGDNYTSNSNIVFPVEFQGTRLINKKPKIIATGVHTYYFLRSKFGDRKLCKGRESIKNEARKLKQLEGLRIPRLYYNNSGIIIREYIDGKDFRQLENRGEIGRTLEDTLEIINKIHERGVAIGDCHARNIIFGENGTYYIDFDGKFDETDMLRARALDIVKLVNSTYYITRDKALSIYAAEMAARTMRRETIEAARNLLEERKISDEVLNTS